MVAALVLLVALLGSGTGRAAAGAGNGATAAFSALAALATQAAGDAQAGPVTRAALVEQVARAGRFEANLDALCLVRTDCKVYFDQQARPRAHALAGSDTGAEPSFLALATWEVLPAEWQSGTVSATRGDAALLLFKALQAKDFLLAGVPANLATVEETLGQVGILAGGGQSFRWDAPLTTGEAAAAVDWFARYTGELDHSGEMAPAIFIHGFLATSDVWSKAHEGRPGMLTTMNRPPYAPGKTVFLLDWDSEQGVAAGVRALRTQVQAVRGDRGNVPVSLVGHSMGGMVARAYASIPHLGDSLDALVTIGTPHHPIPGAATIGAYDIEPGEYFDHLMAVAPSPQVRFLSIGSYSDELVPIANAHRQERGTYQSRMLSRQGGEQAYAVGELMIDLPSQPGRLHTPMISDPVLQRFVQTFVLRPGYAGFDCSLFVHCD